MMIGRSQWSRQNWKWCWPISIISPSVCVYQTRPPVHIKNLNSNSIEWRSDDCGYGYMKDQDLSKLTQKSLRNLKLVSNWLIDWFRKKLIQNVPNWWHICHLFSFWSCPGSLGHQLIQNKSCLHVVVVVVSCATNRERKCARTLSTGWRGAKFKTRIKGKDWKRTLYMYGLNG